MRSQVVAVLRKELTEYRRNKMIIITMGLLPLFFLGVPIAGALALHGDVPLEAYKVAVGQAALLFFIIPTILPTTVAAYTVIGEREQGTLEPVLTTAATDGDLLLGKAIAATAPAIVLAWTFFAIFLIVVRVWAAPQVVDLVYQPQMFAGQLLLDPALAIFAIVVGMMLSVRASDIRVAQQLSGLVMLPIFGAASLPAFRVIEPTVSLYVGAAIVIGVVDAVGFRFLLGMFDRERLLTRYGR